MKHFLVFFNDNTHGIVFHPNGTPEELLAMVLHSAEKSRENVVGYAFIGQDLLDLGWSNLAYRNGKVYVDKAKIIEKKLTNIRAFRNAILNKLDLPRKLAEEKGDVEDKAYLDSLVKFLRDLPKNLDFKGLSDKEVVELNPFNNITSYYIEDGGEGYTSEPEVIVGSPENPRFTAKARAIVENGRVVKVEALSFGCGYKDRPEVVISNPENGRAAKVIAILENVVQF